MQINGSTILVTGASGGLGGAMCRELAGRGARLVVTARREALLADLAAEIGAEVLVADLTDRADVHRVADRAADCDVLVANAGVGADPPLADLTEESIDFSIDVNLRAPIVINHRTRRGRQVISLNEEYSMRAPLFSEEEREVLVAQVAPGEDLGVAEEK